MISKSVTEAITRRLAAVANTKYNVPVVHDFHRHVEMSEQMEVVVEL